MKPAAALEALGVSSHMIDDGLSGLVYYQSIKLM